MIQIAGFDIDRKPSEQEDRYSMCVRTIPGRTGVIAQGSRHRTPGYGEFNRFKNKHGNDRRFDGAINIARTFVSQENEEGI